MGYFQVRYDSRVVNYNRKLFIRLATGLVAMGGGSCSKDCGFNFEHCKLYRHYFTYIYLL